MSKYEHKRWNPLWLVEIVAWFVLSATLCQAASPVVENSLVDINHATIQQLLTVPGMTSSWAGRIVRFRPYRVKTDLVDHGVMPQEVYQRLRAYIVARQKP